MSTSCSYAVALLSVVVCVQGFEATIAEHVKKSCAGAPQQADCPVGSVHIVDGESANIAGGRKAAVQVLDEPQFLHMTPLLNGAVSWSNLPDGKSFHDVPNNLKFLPLTMASWALAPGTVVTYSCPDAPDDIEVCDAWLFYYNCPACNPNGEGGIGGGLISLLTLDMESGWERNNCAPKFTNGWTEVRHPMKALRKQLEPGESAEFITPGVGEFFAFSVDSRGINCGLPYYQSAATCPTGSDVDYRCVWDGITCKSQNCQQPHFTGPGGCPGPCPWDGPRDALFGDVGF